MKDTPSGAPTLTSENRGARWTTLAAFVAATAAGAGLLGGRWMMRGNADPFDVDWPLYLQLGAGVLTFVVGFASGRPLAAVGGLFVGLNLVMWSDGRAEYPVASVIALSVHGGLPALAGALCAAAIPRVSSSQRSKECA